MAVFQPVVPPPPLHSFFTATALLVTNIAVAVGPSPRTASHAGCEAEPTLILATFDESDPSTSPFPIYSGCQRQLTPSRLQHLCSRPFPALDRSRHTFVPARVRSLIYLPRATGELCLLTELLLQIRRMQLIDGVDGEQVIQSSRVTD